MSKKFNEIDWSQVDWSRRRVDIAKDLDIHTSALSRHAKTIGIPPRTAGNPRGGVRIVDWSAVDWSKNNETIAAETGAKPSTVNQNRGRYGEPRRTRSSLLAMLDVGGGSVTALLQAMQPGAVLYFPYEWKTSLEGVARVAGIYDKFQFSKWDAFAARGVGRIALVRVLCTGEEANHG